MTDNTLTFTSPEHNRFVFACDYRQLPSVNGIPINLAPPQVFDSPFIQSAWNSGIVTIQKDSRQLTLNFN